MRYPDKLKLVSTGRIAPVCSGRGASPPCRGKYIFVCQGNIFLSAKGNIFVFAKGIYFYLPREIYFCLPREIYFFPGEEILIQRKEGKYGKILSKCQKIQHKGLILCSGEVSNSSNCPLNLLIHQKLFLTKYFVFYKCFFLI